MIVSRYHDFSCGHRIYGHPGKCAMLHGHNYRVHFECAGEILHIGMVVDFSVMKATLCEYLEKVWDHRMLIWEDDPMLEELKTLCDKHSSIGSVVSVPFNPTAENIAQYLLTEIGPLVLPPTIKLVRVIVEETRKCSAIADTITYLENE